MTTTTNLQLTYLAPSQSQPEVPINDAWNKLDAAVAAAASAAAAAGTVAAAAATHAAGSLEVGGLGGITTINFTGATVTAGSAAGVATVAIAAGSSSGTTGGTSSSSAASIWTPVAANTFVANTTGWTSEQGTWAIAGGVLVQSDTTAAPNRLMLTAPVPYAAMQMQVDVKLASAGATSTLAGGLAINDGSSWTNMADICLRWVSGAPLVVADNFGNADVAVSTQAWGALDTWHTLTLIIVGERHVVYVDGAAILSYVAPNVWANFQAFGLFCYGGAASFRNFSLSVLGVASLTAPSSGSTGGTTTGAPAAYSVWQITMLNQYLHSPSCSIAEIAMASVAGGPNLCTGGTAAAPTDAGSAASNAVDGNPATSWTYTASDAFTPWQYQFPEPVSIVEIRITARADAPDTAPHTFQLYCSNQSTIANDGTDGYLQMFSAGPWTAGQTQVFTVTNTTLINPGSVGT